MKILELRSENFKRLSVVQIRPDGSLVQIGGKNAAGKSSVLDSILAVLGGKGALPSTPIRQGAESARITAKCGELNVERQFRKTRDGEISTTVTVTTPDGAAYRSPQALLDSLLGELTFDPLAFSRMEPKQQFDALRKFVPSVDFEAIDNANRGDFQRRADINRQAREARTVAQSIVVPTDTPEEPIDESKLVDELQKAGEHNAEIEQRKANRAAVAQNIESEVNAVTRHEAAIEELEEEIAKHRREIDAIRVRATQLQVELDEAPPLPEPLDTSAIRRRIEEARATNENVRKLDARMDLHKRAAELETQAKEITARMEQRNAAKEAAIAAAEMPVPGLAFGDGVVLLNGLPLDVASAAEQLRLSVAIGMAMNPKLRVLLIKDGSLLDEESLRMIAEMAEKNDFQVWLERVGDDKSIGFVLENGMLKDVASEEAAA